MHEHSLADAILEKADERRRAAGAIRLRKITVQVSELAATSPQALQMMMNHAAEEMGLEPPQVEVVVDGLLGHCPNCGVVRISDDLVCSNCGRQGVRPAGDEAMLLLACEFD